MFKLLKMFEVFKMLELLEVLELLRAAKMLGVLGMSVLPGLLGRGAAATALAAIARPFGTGSSDPTDLRSGVHRLVDGDRRGRMGSDDEVLSAAATDNGEPRRRSRERAIRPRGSGRRQRQPIRRRRSHRRWRDR
jgi:hypothetical protein